MLKIFRCLTVAVLVFTIIVSATVNSSSNSTEAATLPPAAHKENLKVLPMVAEPSVSTYVPSDAAPGTGLAVNIIYPSRPRYKDGAPINVVVPGGRGASGLRFSMHSAQVGFVEVRFAFPGGGLSKFHSDGSWDERGVDSQKALRDVLRYAAGQINDYQGRPFSELVPVKLDALNIGATGWANGGNILLVTLAKFHEDLSFMKWIAFYETPLGALISTDCLGTVNDIVLNKYYKQGSAATEHPAIDFSKLRWNPDIVHKSIDSRMKKGLETPKGVLYFDDNGSGSFDDTTEFPISFGTLPRTNKQFYPPEVLTACMALKLFGQKPTEITESTPVEEIPLGKIPVKKVPRPAYVHEKRTFFTWNELPPVQLAPISENEKAVETDAPWPERIATLPEAEAYWQERDGSLYVKQVAEKYPNLMVMLFGSQLDHEQRQSDHPHIAMHYNMWLSAKPRWVRLNPDPLYAGFTADMNPSTFVGNQPNEPIDAQTIARHLEPEGMIPDYMFMQAVVSEMADRAKTNTVASPLRSVFVQYYNDAMKEYKAHRSNDEDIKYQRYTSSAHEAFVNRAKRGNIDLLFIGDSTAASWVAEGKSVWDKEFAGLSAESFGIGKETSASLLKRMVDHELDNISPRAVIVQTGTNDLDEGVPPSVVIAKMTEIVEEIKTRLPSTRVVLVGILPRGSSPDDSYQAEIKKINEGMAKLANGKDVRYLNPAPVLTKGDGNLMESFYKTDRVHLTTKGYEALEKALRTHLQDLKANTASPGKALAGF